MKEKITRRSFLQASAGIAAATGLAACSAEETTSTATSTSSTSTADTAVEVEAVKTPEEILNGATITGMLVSSQYSDNLAAMFTAMEENLGVKFDLQVIPNDQNTSMLQMKAATNDLPDLILENVPDIYSIIDPVDSLYDLSDEEWVSRLIAPDVPMHTDGKTYGFPFTSLDGFQAMIYNKDLFDAKGWQVPTTPDEFDALCETIKADGITPILSASEPWVTQVWTSAGFARAMGSDEAAKAMSDSVIAGEKTFNDYPELAYVIDELLLLNEKGYFNTDLATLTWDETWIRIVDQEAAMIMGPANRVAEKAPVFPDTHFSMFNVPVRYDDNNLLSSTPFSSGFTVAQNSKNIDAVKAMLSLLSQDEYGSMYFANGVAGFPAFEEVSGGDLQDDILEILTSASSEGRLLSEMNTWWSVWGSIAVSTIRAYLNEAMIKKNMDGAAVLDLFQEDVNKYMQSIGAEGF